VMVLILLTRKLSCDIKKTAVELNHTIVIMVSTKTEI
jgi:hypothetical protein